MQYVPEYLSTYTPDCACTKTTDKNSKSRTSGWSEMRIRLFCSDVTRYSLTIACDLIDSGFVELLRVHTACKWSQKAGTVSGLFVYHLIRHLPNTKGN